MGIKEKIENQTRLETVREKIKEFGELKWAGVSFLFLAISLLLLIPLLSIKNHDWTEKVWIPIVTNSASAFLVIVLSFIFLSIYKHWIEHPISEIIDDVKEKEKEKELKDTFTKLVKEITIDITIPDEIKNHIINTSEAITKWGPADACALDILCREGENCPHELRRLRNIITNVFKNKELKTDLIREIIELRFNTLAEQMKSLPAEGKWDILNTKTVSLTQADYAYELIQDVLFKERESTWIKAATLFKYIPWWISDSGLNYLQKQRNLRSVQRIFVFPGRFGLSLFGPDSKKYLNEEVSRFDDVFEGKDNFYKECTLWVLALHWCLNIEVYLISPSLKLEFEVEKIIETKWPSNDIAIFGKTIDNVDHPICAIDTLISSHGYPTNTFNPSGGSVYFKSNEYYSFFNSVKNGSINFDKFVNFPHVKQKIESIALILCYKSLDERKNQNAQLLKSIIDSDIADKIRNLVGYNKFYQIEENKYGTSENINKIVEHKK